MKRLASLLRSAPNFKALHISIVDDYIIYNFETVDGRKLGFRDWIKTIQERSDDAIYAMIEACIISMQINPDTGEYYDKTRG